MADFAALQAGPPHEFLDDHDHEQQEHDHVLRKKQEQKQREVYEFIDDPLSQEDPVSRRVRIKLLFDKLDDTGTGTLDADNLRRRYEELGKKAWADTCSGKEEDKSEDLVASSSALMYAKELVRICDETKTGSIDFPEFERFVRRKEREIWKSFQQIGNKADLTITPSELKASLRAAGIDASEEEVDAFIAHVDTDCDGVIDFYEWRDFLLLLPHSPTLKNIFKYYRSLFDVDFNSGDAGVALLDFVGSPAFHVRLKYFVAGGIAGAISRTATAPLDRIRVILQTQTFPSPTKNSGPFSNVLSAFRAVYNSGGLRAFYRGNGLNVVKIIPESALKFVVFEQVKLSIAQVQGHGDSGDIGMAGRFAAGGVAGLVSQFAIYPLETVKTRLMAEISQKELKSVPASTSPTSTKKASSSSLPSTSSSLSSSSASKISSSASAASDPRLAFQGSAFGTTTAAAKPTPPATTSSTTGFMRCYGSSSGAAAVTGSKDASLVWTTMRSMWREGGIRPFYRGCVPSLVGIVPYAGIDLAIFETLKMTWVSYWMKNGSTSASGTNTPHRHHGLVTECGQPALSVVLLFGMISGSISACIMYPLSVVRTRLQAQGTPAHPHRYSSASDVIRRTYRREGVKGFYKGLTPTLGKVVPAVSISYVCYEGMKRMLGIGTQGTS
ncbi:hypothetical protein HK102_008792 [Quaeritorhiza haematococci]|nr:hypothetical protein HK102_008792 [Quaeritorhiza haematococci]